MRRTEPLLGLRLMKFEDVYGRTDRGAPFKGTLSGVPGHPETGRAAPRAALCTRLVWAPGAAYHGR